MRIFTRYMAGRFIGPFFFGLGLFALIIVLGHLFDKMNKLISQAVVHGDKRKYLTALITLDPDALKAFAQEHNLSGSHAELTKKPEVRAAVAKAMDELNARLASYESIKKFEILETDFSVESGELTPKLSVKRKVVNERYKHLFDKMYDEKAA